MVRGNGEGTTRRQPCPDIFFDGPALLSGKPARRLFVQLRTDGLGRIGKCRVMTVDDGLGDDGHGLPINPALAKFVIQCLEEHVADASLQVGTGIIHGHRRHFMKCQFRPSQDEAHLWAVSMRHHHIPTGFDHVGDIVRGNRRFLTLVRDGFMLFVSDQRVAPDGDNGKFIGG